MKNKGQTSNFQYIIAGIAVVALIISLVSVLGVSNNGSGNSSVSEDEFEDLQDTVSSLEARVSGLEGSNSSNSNNNTEARSLKIVGSTTVLPIAKDAAQAWQDEHPNDSISVSGGGSGGGIQALIDGNTDIADASRSIKESEMEAAEKAGVDPVEHSVAKGAVCLVVHPDNPVEDLSIEEARSIFSGEITDWSEMGWDDGGQIQVYNRESGSGTRGTFVDGIMGTEKVTSAASTVKSNGGMRESISGNSHGIGYVGLGYLNQNIKALKLDGVMPSKETAASGEYEVTRTLFMYTDGEATGLEEDFINFVKNATEIINNNGFIPLE